MMRFLVVFALFVSCDTDYTDEPQCKDGEVQCRRACVPLSDVDLVIECRGNLP
jgi:hypothetical protein